MEATAGMGTTGSFLNIDGEALPTRAIRARLVLPDGADGALISFMIISKLY